MPTEFDVAFALTVSQAPAFPNASNTGPEAAGYTITSTVSTPTNYNTDDQVITGVRFTDIPTVNADRVTFRGCEWKITDVDFFITRLNGLDAVFEDCRFRPADTDAPPVTRAQSYQQAIKMFDGAAGLRVSRCEFWGFGNAIEFGPGNSTEAHPLIVEDSYFHDAADQAGSTYHHDGVLSSNPSEFVTLHHNTIVSGGNTNAIAFQSVAGDPQWDHLIITNNLLGGFGYTVNLGDDIGAANVTFTGNVLTTLIEPIFGPFKNDWAGFGGVNEWSGNKYLVPAGAEYGDPSWNGQFWWPTDGKLTGGHAADFTG